jgi:hypothetical protein
MSASPSEIASHSFFTSLPGPSTPSPFCCDAAWKEVQRVERELGEDEPRHDRRAAEQQHRLDDLHPRRGEHAAEQQEREHDDADDRHGTPSYGSPKIRSISVPAPTICAIK